MQIDYVEDVTTRRILLQVSVTHQHAPSLRQAKHRGLSPVGVPIPTNDGKTRYCEGDQNYSDWAFSQLSPDKTGHKG